VGDVVPDGPGANGGLQAGDIVTTLNGQAMANANQLRNSVADLDPDSNVNLEVVRNGSVVNLAVQLGTRDMTQLASFQHGSDSSTSAKSKLGLSVEAPNADLRNSLNISIDGGVVVNEVDSTSMAAQVGVQRGDLIVSINGTEVNSLSDYDEAMATANLASGVRMRVYRDGGTRFVFMKSSS
jgi:serine protease Do